MLILVNFKWFLWFSRCENFKWTFVNLKKIRKQVENFEPARKTKSKTLNGFQLTKKHKFNISFSGTIVIWFCGFYVNSKFENFCKRKSSRIGPYIFTSESDQIGWKWTVLYERDCARLLFGKNVQFSLFIVSMIDGHNLCHISYVI